MPSLFAFDVASSHPEIRVVVARPTGIGDYLLYQQDSLSPNRVRTLGFVTRGRVDAVQFTDDPVTATSLVPGVRTPRFSTGGMVINRAVDTIYVCIYPKGDGFLEGDTFVYAPTASIDLAANLASIEASQDAIPRTATEVFIAVARGSVVVNGVTHDAPKVIKTSNWNRVITAGVQGAVLVMFYLEATA